MEYFMVTGLVELHRRPEWLDDFRKKYDEPFPYHVTLKNLTQLQKGTRQQLAQTLGGLLQGLIPVPLSCDSLRIASTPNGACIMIDDRKTQEIYQLQTFIRKLLSPFGTHKQEHFARYEREFQPHITIGRHIPDVLLAHAQHDITSDLLCEGVLNKIMLVFVESERFDDFERPLARYEFVLGDVEHRE